MVSNTIRDFSLTSADGFPLSCAAIQADKARGAVMILHGAKEDKKRYFDFGTFLARAGFHVYLMDLRGHGASINGQYPPGYMDDPDLLVRDILTLSAYTKRQSALPLFIYAHSFASVLARCFLQSHDHLLDGLIMSGTVRPIPSTLLAAPAAKVIARFCGKYGHFPPLMRFGDPVSENPDFRFCNASVAADWTAIRDMSRIRRYSCRKPDLPILSVTGQLDPVAGGDRGLKHSLDQLERCGYMHVHSIVYPQMGHSLLQETDGRRVQMDITDFLSMICPSESSFADLSVFPSLICGSCPSGQGFA